MARTTAPARAGVALALIGGAGLASHAASSRLSPVHAGHAPAPAATPRSKTAPDALARAIADDAPLPITMDAAALPDRTAQPDTADRLVQGPMEDVLYGGPSGRAAIAPEIVAQALRLLGHKLDLTRDLALGDRVRLLLRAADPAAKGRAATLDYVELDGAQGVVRLYRVDDGGDEADAFVDERDVGLRRLLLRTPLAHPRQTSGFGWRFHPLLGFSRMHKGVDFGAAVGTPILAAGDGVVTDARWAGGYGRLVRLRHDGGFSTGYAHLSAWAPGLHPGAIVRQGQVIGWTGASGLATGPHLHFEVLYDGQPIDPATATPTAAPVSPARVLAFAARRRKLDLRLAEASANLSTARSDPRD